MKVLKAIDVILYFVAAVFIGFGAVIYPAWRDITVPSLVIGFIILAVAVILTFKVSKTKMKYLGLIIAALLVLFVLLFVNRVEDVTELSPGWVSLYATNEPSNDEWDKPIADMESYIAGSNWKYAEENSDIKLSDIIYWDDNKGCTLNKDFVGSDDAIYLIYKFHARLKFPADRRIVVKCNSIYVDKTKGEIICFDKDENVVQCLVPEESNESDGTVNAEVKGAKDLSEYAEFIAGNKELTVNYDETYAKDGDVEAVIAGLGNEDVYEVGKDIVITQSEIDSYVKFYNAAKEDDPEEKAVRYANERNALYAAAMKNGFDVSNEEIEEYLNGLKDALKADENKDMYEQVVAGFGSEKDYWAYLSETHKTEIPIQKYVEYLKENYREELDTSDDEDFEELWASKFEQIKDELVEEESFIVISIS